MSIDVEGPILEAIRIRYLIVRAGGMATKSGVEDVLIAKGIVQDRHAGHEIMNDIEFYRLDVWPGRPWPSHYGQEPDIADYPEIFAAKGVRFYHKELQQRGLIQ